MASLRQILRIPQWTHCSSVKCNSSLTDPSDLISKREVTRQDSNLRFLRNSPTVSNISCDSSLSDAARASDIAPTSALAIREAERVPIADRSVSRTAPERWKTSDDAAFRHHCIRRRNMSRRVYLACHRLGF